MSDFTRRFSKPEFASGAARLRPIVIAVACISLLAAGASADTFCLIDEAGTGFELGNRQLAVTLKNVNPDQEIEGVQCTPDSGFLDPGVADSSTGQAAYAADSRGFSALTSALAGGETTGTVYASVLGSMKLIVRVEAEPAYSGPTTVDVEVPFHVDVTGSGSASGVGSQFGGTYHTEVYIKEVYAALGTSLVDAQGVLATATASLYTPTTSIDVDTDYVLTVVHTQQVSASAGPGTMAGTLSSASSGTSGLSFDVVITDAFDDPNLTRVFPMLDVLDTPAPEVGFPPPLPLPEPSPLSQGSWALALCCALARWQRAGTPRFVSMTARKGRESFCERHRG